MGESTLSIDNPTTHISSLANLYRDFCIQMIPAADLIGALDRCSDLRHDRGETMAEHFFPLLEKKEAECSEWFNTNLAIMGIQEPLIVIVYSHGWWQMDDGGHRLIWAYRRGLEVPVLFDDSGADDESVMQNVVRRAEIEAYHDTASEDLLATAEIRMVDEISTELAWQASVIPRQRGRHRARQDGGRHRAAT